MRQGRRLLFSPRGEKSLQLLAVLGFQGALSQHLLRSRSEYLQVNNKLQLVRHRGVALFWNRIPKMACGLGARECLRNANNRHLVLMNDAVRP